MSIAAYATECFVNELLEHRRVLLRQRDKYSDIIERALTEILEIHIRGGGNVLGDFIDSNEELMLDEIEQDIPDSLNELNRGLLFRAIEILNEINN